jgi:methionyl-tRNA formyltransferase
MPAMLIDQRIRALNPYYLANTVLGSTPITISSGTSSQASINSSSGEVIAIDNAGVHVSTGEGVYCMTALSFDSEWRGDAVGAADNKLYVSAINWDRTRLLIAIYSL